MCKELCLVDRLTKQSKKLRTSYIVCGAQCKIKIWDSLFKNYEEFQHGNSRALSQVWALLHLGPIVNAQGVHLQSWPCCPQEAAVQ